MRKRFNLLLLLILFVISPGSSQAEDANAGEAEEEPGMVGKAGNYIDGAQIRATEGFGAFMTRVDGFFTDSVTNSDALTNDSWARIRIDTQAVEGGKFEMDPSVKVRVSLPNTERRFKLLLSTEGDDTDSVGDNIGGAQSTTVRNNQNASVAIRFIRSARTNGNADVDLGVRQREGNVQYFGRVSLGYRTKLKRRWDFSASNSYWHYNKSGFQNRMTFDFTRVLFYNEDFFFRSFTELNWRKDNKGAILGQTLGLYTQFGNKRALALEALASYHTALNEGVSDRYRGHEIRIRWKHSIWRHWFSYEVWPSVSWPSENEYERLYSLLFRLEMTIGNRWGCVRVKLVCISDTHGDHEKLDLPSGDVLIHAGDLTGHGSPAETRAFMHWFGKQAFAHKLCIAGNHDAFMDVAPVLAAGFAKDCGVQLLNDSGCRIEGVNFWGSPITPRFMDWSFMRDPGASIEAHWNLIPKNTDVLITHGPPLGIMDEVQRSDDVFESTGCPSLLKRVDEVAPLLHIFGHIHEGHGRVDHSNTSFFNVSTMNKAYSIEHTPICIELKINKSGESV